MIIVDTGVLYAFFVAEDPFHEQASLLFRQLEGVHVISPFVLAELDYFVTTRFGIDGEMAMFNELLEGTYELPTMGWDDIRTCRTITSTHRDKLVGLTDASLVVLADRYRTSQIATFDRRHFTSMRGLDGQPFVLLP